MDADKYDKIAQAYSLLPEIPDSDQYRLSGAKLDKKVKLPGPQVGEQYGLYFNLQAMYNGVFGQIPKHGFKAMQSKMHLTDRQKAGKERGCSYPDARQKTNVFYSGSIYSCTGKKTLASYGKIEGYVRSALLSDVVFSVNKTKVEKIKNCTEGRGPCCYVDGTFERRLMPGEIYNTCLDWDNPKYRKQLEKDGWRQIIFNPFAGLHFKYLEPRVFNSPFYQPFKTFDAFTAEYAVLMSQPRSWEQINGGGRPYLILAKNINKGDVDKKAGWSAKGTAFVRKS